MGLALRLRGSGDFDLSNMLTESRVFVRLMTSPPSNDDAIARMTTLPPGARDPGQITLMIGVGAAFGTGEPDYLERFRNRY